MKNIHVIKSALNATFSLFQAGRMSRLRVGILLSLLLGASVAPTAASACRVYIEPAQRIRAAFDAVAIVEIVSSRRTGEEQPDFHPWQALGRLVSVVQGNVRTSSFEFTGSQSSTACDLRRPPEPKERWVVYVHNGAAGTVVSEAYPLDEMLRVDARLRKLPRPSDR